jgi:hypothetical protein
VRIFGNDFEDNIMKKIFGTILAFSLIFSTAFFSANAQSSVVVKKSKGAASKTWQGGKYVYRKGANGTRYVYRKTKNGTVYVGKQTMKGGKWTFHKGKRGTKAVVSRTKKILN